MQIMMIFFRFSFPFFIFLCFFFAPRCSVRATSAGALPLSSWFYIGWHPMPQKKTADFSLPFVCSFRGIIPRFDFVFCCGIVFRFL